MTSSHQEAKSYWLHSAQLLRVFSAVVVYAAFRDSTKELTWHHAVRQANAKECTLPIQRNSQRRLSGGGVEGKSEKSLPRGGEKKKLARECKAVSQIFLLFSKWARYNYLKYVHLTVTSKQYICVYACIYTILIAWVNILLSKIKEAHWISSLKAKVATN